METDKIKYKIKTASEQSILIHLRECNDNFSPPLVERVDVEGYSRKIWSKSITFEAWLDDLLIGLLAAYFDEGPNHSVYITNVSVMKDFTKLGIASELLHNCIEYAINKDFRQISLEVYKENTPAISLYKRFEFKNNGENGVYWKMKMELIK
jgi:ribosomal protein S18 acetylase RimI-like enzyme